MLLGGFKKVKVLIGITGGISAYKILELIRLLKKDNHEVKTILTPFAKEFITELSLKTLTENEVYTDEKWKMYPLSHIDLVRWCDMFLIAPATINTISKIKNAIADNLLTTSVLACDRPIVIAPAANTKMYLNDLAQQNISFLKNLKNFYILDSPPGELACKEEGPGRLKEPDEIYDSLKAISFGLDFRGLKVLVVAGATREYIDDVRFITNGSSSKFGKAIYKALQGSFADVHYLDATLFSSESLLEALKERVKDFDVLIMNAAVSDFTPKERLKGKLKKESKDSLFLELVKTKDILTELKDYLKGKYVLGFSLEERDNLLQNAQKKLINKNLSAIVANPLEVMNSDFFEGFFITRDKIIPIEKMRKDEASFHILKLLKTEISL